MSVVMKLSKVPWLHLHQVKQMDQVTYVCSLNLLDGAEFKSAFFCPL